VDLQIITIDNPEGLNMILGHAHFIKTVEDIHEVMVNTVPGAWFVPRGPIRSWLRWRKKMPCLFQRGTPLCFLCETCFPSMC